VSPSRAHGEENGNLHKDRTEQVEDDVMPVAGSPNRECLMDLVDRGCQKADDKRDPHVPRFPNAFVRVSRSQRAKE
jgi:hypothetical protein